MPHLTDDFSLKSVNLNASQKARVRILVGQPHWDASDWEERDSFYKFRNEEKPRLWLEAFLQKAKQNNCDLVLLPELSVPESLVVIISAWSKQTGTMVIGGSHYHETENRVIGRSPIAYKEEVYYVEKIHPAPIEVSPIQGKGLQPGKALYFFNDSPVGNLGILICSDYLKEDVKNLILHKPIDILCIPAFQNDSDRYHKRIEIDVDNQSGGLFVLYANNILSKVGDGKSAVFAIMDNLFRKKLIAEGHTDESYDSMLCQLKDNEDFFVVEVDLKQKRPAQRRNIDSRPNVVIVERGSCLVAKPNLPDNSPTFQPTAVMTKLVNHTELRESIIESVKGLVARHGLDDYEWRKAFSSMYFLVWLGKLLRLNDQEEYKNLLDHFLQFFYFRANDTLCLREDQILVTPDENENIRKCMEDEDAEDPYFAMSPKTRASSVNAQLLHENYLYGVALGIGAQEDSKIMRAVTEAAISHLVYRTSPSARDTHGGWSPYRVPWITARILISFSYVNLAQRQDGEYIRSIINQGLESLIRRLQPQQYWRSGVGNWVSKWECTALCLEAFLKSDRDKRFTSVISAMVNDMFKANPEWTRTQPSFSTEESSNETLAATLMSSVILRMIGASWKISEQIPSTVEAALYKHLLNVLDKASQTTKHEPRQSCTIPQIAAYCAAAVLEQQ